MFWIGLFIGIIATILVEFIYCALTLGSYEDDE